MSRPRVDKIIVIDVESTCWAGMVPTTEVNEIIEVGVAVIDTFKKDIVIVEGCSLIVKPVYSRVSEFCTQLTGWTQEAVDEGATFEDTCLWLQDKYDTRYRTWGSWGNYDKNMFVEQCKTRHINYPFSWNHLNIQNFTSLKYGWKKGRGMMKALNKLDIPHTGRHHNGGDDAHNIAKILCKALWD